MEDSIPPSSDLAKRAAAAYARNAWRRNRQAYRVGFIAGKAWARCQQIGLVYVGVCVAVAIVASSTTLMKIGLWASLLTQWIGGLR